MEEKNFDMSRFAENNLTKVEEGDAERVPLRQISTVAHTLVVLHTVRKQIDSQTKIALKKEQWERIKTNVCLKS